MPGGSKHLVSLYGQLQENGFDAVEFIRDDDDLTLILGITEKAVLRFSDDDGILICDLVVRHFIESNPPVEIRMFSEVTASGMLQSIQSGAIPAEVVKQFRLPMDIRLIDARDRIAIGVTSELARDNELNAIVYAKTQNWQATSTMMSVVASSDRSFSVPVWIAALRLLPEGVLTDQLPEDLNSLLQDFLSASSVPKIQARQRSDYFKNRDKEALLLAYQGHRTSSRDDSLPEEERDDSRKIANALAFRSRLRRAGMGMTNPFVDVDGPDLVMESVWTQDQIESLIDIIDKASTEEQVELLAGAPVDGGWPRDTRPGALAIESSSVKTLEQAYSLYHEVLADWLAAEVHPDAILEMPRVLDVEFPTTKKFHQTLERARQQEMIVGQPGNTDLADTKDFIAAVNQLSTDWENAKRVATEFGPYFDSKEESRKYRIFSASWALAKDSGTHEAEREKALSVVQENIESLFPSRMAGSSSSQMIAAARTDYNDWATTAIAMKSPLGSLQQQAKVELERVRLALPAPELVDPYPADDEVPMTVHDHSTDNLPAAIPTKKKRWWQK